MPLNTENESNIPENSDDTTQRLEKYGVWVKKAPHEVNQNKDAFNDDDTTLSVDELSGITSSFTFIEEKPESEEVSLEEFGLEEQSISEDKEESLPEQSAFDSYDQEMNSLLPDDQENLAPSEITETEEFIIENNIEDASHDTLSFSADDILNEASETAGEPVTENIEEPSVTQENIIEKSESEIDFDKFKSFDDVFGVMLKNNKQAKAVEIPKEDDTTLSDSEDTIDFTSETSASDTIEENSIIEEEEFISDTVETVDHAFETDTSDDVIAESTIFAEENNSYDTEEILEDTDFTLSNTENTIDFTAEESFDTNTIENTEVPQKIKQESPFSDDIDLSAFTDGDIDLSAFMDDNPAPPKPISNGSEEIDLDSFMSGSSQDGFSDGDIDLSAFMDSSEHVTLDSFIPAEKKTIELEDEPPIDMSLAFDDEFAVKTKADPVNDVETITIDSDGSISEFSSFDAMFDSIPEDQDEFGSEDAFVDDNVRGKEETRPVYDEASEFDDLLLSLDDTPQIQAPKDDIKPKSGIIEYTLSVNLDDDVDSVITEKEETEQIDEAEIDDIPLFTGAENGTFYKELDKSRDTGYTIPKILEAGSDMEFDELDDLLKDADLVSDNTADDTISFDQTQEVPNQDPFRTEETVEDDIPGESPSSSDITFDDTVLDSAAPDAELSPDSSAFELNEQESGILDDTSDSFDISFDNLDDSSTEIVQDETFSSDDVLSQGIADEDVSESEEHADAEIVFEEETIPVEDAAAEPSVVDSGESAFESSAEDQDVIDGFSSGSGDEIVSENGEEDIEPEIDIEIPEDTVFADTNTADLDTLAQNLPVDADFEDLQETGFDEDIDQDLDVQETIDQTPADDTNEDDSAAEQKQENSMDLENNPLLDKIAQEITALRAEISSLKDELSFLKHDSKSQEEPSKESGGFFSDDEGDDTIALSGDELNNILINADFTEEYAESPASDSNNESENKVETETVHDEMSVETPFDDTVQNSDLTVVEEQTEITSEAELSPSESENDSVETENQFEEFDPFGSVSDVDSINDIVQEDFFEDNELNIDENLQEPSPEELNMDSLSFVQQEDASHDEQIPVPSVEDIIVGPSSSDLMDSMQESSDQTADQIVLEENIIEEKEESFDEPVQAVFESSQWDAGEEIKEEESGTDEASVIDDVKPLQSNTESITKDTGTAVPKELQQDIKSVLLYMDQLLENLPEDKIEEFARSEHFNVYKKLFNELGLV